MDADKKLIENSLPSKIMLNKILEICALLAEDFSANDAENIRKIGHGRLIPVINAADFISLSGRKIAKAIRKLKEDLC